MKQTPGIAQDCDEARGILFLLVAMLAAAVVVVAVGIEVVRLIF